ncbi:glycosyltransferase [Candidatus Micrarchaeota archaeon]|nr:glycosyltransferase [Candidatus Micrarchaeota archaeon]
MTYLARAGSRKPAGKPPLAFVISDASVPVGARVRYMAQIAALTEAFEVHALCPFDAAPGPVTEGMPHERVHLGGISRLKPEEAGAWIGGVLQEEGIRLVWAAGFHAGLLSMGIKAGFKAVDFCDSGDLNYRSRALAAASGLDIANALLSLGRYAARRGSQKKLAKHFDAAAYCCRRDGLESGFLDGEFIVLPNLVMPRPLEEGRRDGIVMLGDWDYWPNTIALKDFARRILPRLGSEVSVRILGPARGKEALGIFYRIKQAERGVEAVGWVDSLQAELQKSRLMLAPTRYGSGVSGKALMGLNAALPIVTTHFVREGIDPGGQCPALIPCRSDFETVKCIESLLSDENKGKKLGMEGREFLERYYQDGLAAHRGLFGRMLAAHARAF